MAISASLSSSLAPKLRGSSAFPYQRTALPNFTRHPQPPARSRALRAISAKGATVALAGLAVGEDLPADYGEWFPEADPSERRRAGVLLHPTSFRGPYGIGDLGEEAFRFLDWLHASGCSVWQDGAITGPRIAHRAILGPVCSFDVLPLVPPARKPYEGGSPYSGQDANCGNTLLISLEELVKEGLLVKDELPDAIDADSVNYSIVAELKDPLIAKAAVRLLQSGGDLKRQFEDFCKDPDISSWLQDAAYFAAIDDTLDTFSWYEWPEPLKNRHLAALEETYQRKKDFIDVFVAQQFLFQRQWQKIREYAHKKGIRIMGDMPIYVDYHSADVWANKTLFYLNRKGFPLLVSGVPPDAFSETGQLWNSPLYDWKAMENEGFSWWIRRLRRAQSLYDDFRIDHFRGFAGFWAVPAEAKVAMVGRWKVGPGKPLFDAISKALGKMNIIAEDLGVITEDVVKLRKSIGAPGMAVLQFGFGGDADNPHLPHNHESNQVVYTGTHDNDTTQGWWDNLNHDEKSNVLKYLAIDGENDIPWILIRAVLSSVARTAIIPMQDVLCLGSSARMNTPATELGNWSWRLPSSMSFESLDKEAMKLKDMLSLYGRL